MHLAVVRPNAPAVVWPMPPTGGFGGQKMPALAVLVTAGLDRSGFSEMARSPMNPPSSGRQSSVVSLEPTGVQPRPTRLPALHRPPMHRGHGSVALAVRYVREESGRVRLVMPFTLSIVPLGLAAI